MAANNQCFVSMKTGSVFDAWRHGLHENVQDTKRSVGKVILNCSFNDMFELLLLLAEVLPLLVWRFLTECTRLKVYLLTGRKTLWPLNLMLMEFIVFSRAVLFARELISVFFRFVLMVRKGYRDPPYHNWAHAFSVAHFCYLLYKNTDVLNSLE